MGRAGSRPGNSRSSAGFGRIDTSSRKLVYHGDGHAELGVYSIKTFDPVSRTSLRTVFRLDGLTECEDSRSFHQFMDGNYRFFREQVMISIRSSQIEDLTEPDRVMLGKKLVARVNRALGHSFLKSVSFEEFDLHEAVDDSGFARRENLGGSDKRAGHSTSAAGSALVNGS